MSKLVRAVVLTVMGTALSIGLSPASALVAATTWTVSPGGSFSTPPAFPTLIDTASHFQIPCGSSQLAGSFKSGTGLSGAGIGTVTSATLCAPATTVAWPLNARFYHAGTNVFTGTISKIHFAVPGGAGGRI